MAESLVDHAEVERLAEAAEHLAECEQRLRATEPDGYCTGSVDMSDLHVVLAEYDRRGAELVRVPSDMAVLRGERDRCAAALDAARAELERLRAQRAAVLALHNRDEIGGRLACGHCSMAGLDGAGVPVGPVLIVGWPCPTAETLGVTE